MKLLVIGHYSIDVVHGPDGVETERPGGIITPVKVLSSLVGEGDQVIPVFGVHKNEYRTLVDQLDSIPNVDTAGIFRTEEATHRVMYFTKDDATTVACTKRIAPPIPFERIRKHLNGADGILVNMMSGFDITLETLDHIRMEVRSRSVPVHFDYHNLTLGVNGSDERFRRPLPDWRRWAFMTESVQLNEEEMAGLTLEKLTEDQTVGHFLTLGIKALVLTRGAKGLTLFFSEHKKVHRHDVPPETVIDGDATGCGDVFGAGFLFHNITSKDLAASANRAAHLAAGAVRPFPPAPAPM